MIYSMTMFFNELDLLDLKIKEELPHVDRMVIVESQLTHTGNPKPLNFPLNKYKTDKIVYVVTEPNLFEECKKFTGYESAYCREHLHRNMAARVVPIADDDILICTDIDEIVNGENFERIINETRRYGVVRLGMRLFCYYVNVLISNHEWWHPFAFTGKICKGANDSWGYDIDRHRAWTGQAGFKLPDCGNHFTSLGTAEQVALKLKSYSHVEFAAPELLAGLPDRIKNLEDIAARKHMPPMVVVDIDDLHPKTIRENLPEWEKYIRKKEM